MKPAADSSEAFRHPQPEATGDKAPVAFFVFNRPDHTRRSFAAIRAYRPRQLFLVADGPRPEHPEDGDRCRQVRSVVAEIDWECDVRRNYVEANLGSGRRISSGLNWVFDQVSECMILEDDCLATADFFDYCSDLLERYRSDNRVWVISGNSYQADRPRGQGSYYFSRYPDTWGWATWRRAWRHYSHEMNFLSQWIGSPRWEECYPSWSERRHFLRCFQSAISGRVDAWDYQWIGCVMYAGGLAATPNANLVQNIGFDQEATNTRDPELVRLYQITKLSCMVHPSLIEADNEADEYYRTVFRRRLKRRWWSRLRGMVHKCVSKIR